MQYGVRSTTVDKGIFGSEPYSMVVEFPGAMVINAPWNTGENPDAIIVGFRRSQFSQ